MEMVATIFNIFSKYVQTLHIQQGMHFKDRIDGSYVGRDLFVTLPDYNFCCIPAI